MGSYSNAITQDLRTVVEGAETVVSPEALLTQPLSAGLKADQWMQNVSVEQVMPGAVKAGGDVTIEEVSGDIVNRVLQSSDLNLAQIISSTDEHIERSDIFAQGLVDDVLKMTGDITRQRSDELEIGRQVFDKIPDALSAVIVIGIVLYFILKKG